MGNVMKLVVFGATGGTGEQVVRQALCAGHHVTAIARRPDAVSLNHPDLHVRPGDVLQPASLLGAADGADAVLSTLGSREGRSPTRVYSHGTTNIRAEMRRAGVRRLVVASAVPVAPRDQKSTLDRFVIHPLLHLFLGPSYDDLHRMEHNLSTADDVDWTVFRPPRLTDDPAGGYRTAVDTRLPGARRVTHADLAAAMLTSIDDPATVRHTSTVAT